MTNSVAQPAAESGQLAAPPRPPLRIALTILHLGALGLVGWIVFTILITLFSVGLGMVVVLGVGLILLAAMVYALYGTAWYEFARVSGLYRLDLPDLRLRPQTQQGFGGYLRWLARQSVDGPMWRGVGSFFFATFMGTVVLGFFQVAVELFFSAAGLNVAGMPFKQGLLSKSDSLFSPIASIIIATLCLAAVVGIALLHRVVTVAIVRAGSRAARLTQQAQTSARQREGAVRAADLERTRIERDLHDGVQPRLVSVGMTLGLAQQKIDNDPESAKELISEAHTSTKAAITELRQLARGIHASVLDDRGLDAALSALAGRSHIPVVLDVRLQGRCSREAETAVYFAIAESLTNAAKHSRASECRVVVRLRDDNTLWARVEDNGAGGARILPGGGLDGISNRVLAAGGTIRLDSPQGGPTSLEVSVPCAS
ncbi:sensor histidine kinase [Leucobacter coleopterorum]|uniref:histidine kinase n=1 Tax=Leucobacter coleopterorum TaxID=2714933 RepID=A0ABX6JXH1_9MICO|nr:sensor histidine kinase [Leucobacter coleopterorum]QIM17519.1 sensor histidine kinase [Leucobacter coleopterorum]